MKIAIGCDHAAVKMKEIIKEKFSDIEFVDVGTFTEDSCDYPDYIKQVGFLIRDGEVDKGIALCGTGVGASIVANKVRGIRASLCFNEFMAEMTRRHNDSNVLVLGARVIGDELAMSIIKTWLNTDFEGGRHQRRLDKITALENEESQR